MLPIFVMTCVGREPWAADLATQLPASAVFVKDTRRNASANFLTMLHASKDTGALFLEDDVELGPRFLERAAAVIDAHRDVVVQFFTTHTHLEKGLKAPHHFQSSIAFWLPDGYARQILAFARTWPGWDRDHLYDLCVRDFLKARKEAFWLEIPSLVEHRVGPSMISRTRPWSRRAANP